MIALHQIHQLKNKIRFIKKRKRQPGKWKHDVEGTRSGQHPRGGIAYRLPVILSFLLLLSVLMGALAACQNGNATVMTQESLPENSPLLAELPEETIRLYGELQSAEDESYTAMYLVCHGLTKRFDWVSLNQEVWPPQILLEDLNQDGRKELIVILTTATGTGVHTEEVHILNPDTLTAYSVEPLSQAISSQVTVVTTPEQYQMSYNGKTTVLEKKNLESSPDHLFDTPVFAYITRFSMVQDQLTVTLGVQVSPTEFVGDFVGAYTWRDGTFVVDALQFVDASME